MTAERNIFVTITADTSRFEAAMKKLAAAMAKVARAFNRLPRGKRFSMPEPLSIDGHEYRRRSRKRSRR
jgi:hypothetical protein